MRVTKMDSAPSPDLSDPSDGVKVIAEFGRKVVRRGTKIERKF